MKVDFEWRIVPQVGPTHTAYVIERMVGLDSWNEFGPMPVAVAEAFVRIRREFVRRNITSQHEAIKLFTKSETLQ